MRVSIPPGVDGIPTSSIPQDPQAFVTWFTSVYLKRWAANGDARNAVPTSASVQITGSIGTPAGIGIGPNSITNGELVERSPLSVMGNPTGVEGDVQDIIAPADGDSLQRIAGALVWAPSTPTISVADSITGLGSPGSPLQLVNDSVPGASEYYGTDATSLLGYHPIVASNIVVLTQSGGASQLYTIPLTATWVQVTLAGGGGGGGSGILQASGATAGGGSGGGSGAICTAVFSAAFLRSIASTVTVTFSNASGGTGGAAKTATGTGNPGVAGSNVKFGNFLTAAGGTNGLAGATGSAGAGGAGGSPANNAVGVQGGNSNNGAAGSNGAAPTASTTGATSGAGGGGAGTSAVNGGVGGTASLLNTAAGGTAGVGASTGTATGGGNGIDGSGTIGGTGGGGGGGTTTTGTATKAGNGGNGGAIGGGGGGGGSGGSTAGVSSGAGGNGAPAIATIVAY